MYISFYRYVLAWKLYIYLQYIYLLLLHYIIALS